jgi:hypothetical protein
MLPVDHRSTAARRYRTCRPISRQGGPAPSRCQRRSVDNDTWSTPATSCSVNRPSSSPIIPVVTAPPVLPRSYIVWALNRPRKPRILRPRFHWQPSAGRRPREEHRLRIVTDATRDVPVGRERRSGSLRRRRRLGSGTPSATPKQTFDRLNSQFGVPADQTNPNSARRRWRQRTHPWCIAVLGTISGRAWSERQSFIRYGSCSPGGCCRRCRAFRAQETAVQMSQPLGLGAAPGGLLDGWGVPSAWFSSGRSAGPDPGRIVRQVGGGRRR